MASSAIKTPAFQAKAGNIQNEDGSSIYSNGDWSLKNSTALTSVTITDDGNVGIGTDSPTGKLHVNGNVRTDAGFVAVASGITTVLSADASGSYLETQGSNNQRFFTNGTERMRIDASGRLDLGPTTLTNPTYKGKVRLWGGGRATEGGIEFVATNFQNGFGFRIVNPDDGSGSTPLVFQVRSNSTAWTANAFTLYNNGNYAFAGSNVSDERLKEDIHDVESQLQNVLALTPKTFRFKKQQQEDSSTQELGRVQHGFIAQEVKTIMPTLVTGAETNPDEYMGVDYMGLTSILVKAIQEQQAQIEELKAKVSALEAK